MSGNGYTVWFIIVSNNMFYYLSQYCYLNNKSLVVFFKKNLVEYLNKILLNVIDIFNYTPNDILTKNNLIKRVSF